MKGLKLQKKTDKEIFNTLKQAYKTITFDELEQDVKDNLDYLRQYKGVSGKFGNKFHYLKNNFRYLKNQWLTSPKNFTHPLILIKAALFLYYNEKGA